MDFKSTICFVSSKKTNKILIKVSEYVSNFPESLSYSRTFCLQFHVRSDNLEWAFVVEPILIFMAHIHLPLRAVTH